MENTSSVIKEDAHSPTPCESVSHKIVRRISNLFSGMFFSLKHRARVEYYSKSQNKQTNKRTKAATQETQQTAHKYATNKIKC